MKIGPAPLSTPFAAGAAIPVPWMMYHRDTGAVLQAMTSATKSGNFRATVHGNLVFLAFAGDTGDTYALPAFPLVDSWLDVKVGATVSQIAIPAGARDVTIPTAAGTVARGWYMIDLDRPDQRR